MKKNGFTLIELLAVIIILAIIALITVPVIMNIIERANKSAFKDSAYGVIKAGELHYADQLLEPSGMTNDITFTFPNTNLDIKGSKPKSGNMKVTKDGKIELAISNGKWCARKSLNDEDVTIDDNIDDCSLTKRPNPIITTNNSCLTDGICENGTKLNVRVNEKENYDFYVIKDDGNELTLIMNKNIGPKVAWITKEDYEVAGGTNWNSQYGANDKGPLTVLKQLENLTKDWTNIKAYDYTLEDDKPAKLEQELALSDSKSMYQPIKRTNVRARLPKLSDIEDLIVLDLENEEQPIIMPEYLYENLSEANTDGQPYLYWLSTAHSYGSNGSFIVFYYGHVGGSSVFGYYNGGVRPVIKISKGL